jgi:hypothetical protein
MIQALFDRGGHVSAGLPMLSCRSPHPGVNGFIFEFRDSTLRVASATIIIDGKDRKARVRRLACGCYVIGTLREAKAEAKGLVEEIRVKHKSGHRRRN